MDTDARAGGASAHPSVVRPIGVPQLVVTDSVTEHVTVVTDAVTVVMTSTPVL
jgi:hypothetical protein